MPAAEVYAESNPGVGTYATLAQYAYFAGDTKTGDDAAAKAVEEADAPQRKQLQKDLDSAKEAAAQLEKQIAKQAKQGGEEGAFTNPLQGAGTGSPLGAAAPPAPCRPSPASTQHPRGNSVDAR